MKLSKSERQIWLHKILSKRKDCYNLRAFVYNFFGVKLYSNQWHALRDFLDPKVKRVLYSSARQCISGDTQISLKTGKIDQIKNIKTAFKTGIKKVYHVKTKTGKEITCTLDHKFYTQEGWKTLSDVLKYRYEIFVPKNFKYFGNIEINKNRAKILAYLITDGTGYLSSKQSIKFTNTSLILLKDFERCIKAEFPKIVTKWYKKRNGFDILCTAGKPSFKTNELQTWLNSLNWAGHFPIEVTMLKKENLISFLNILYACDGWATINRDKRRGKHLKVEIGFANLEKDFITILQLIFQKFGIHGYITYPKPYDKLYRLRIAKQQSCLNFLYTIDNILGKEKRCEEAKLILKKYPPNMYRHWVYKDNWDKIMSYKYVGKRETYDMEIIPEHYYIANGIKVHNSGKTQIIALACAIAPIFYDNIHFYIFAPKLEQAQISFDRFSSFIHNNPYNIYAGAIVLDKADRIKFANGTEIRAITASRNADITGLTTHIICLDESNKISPYKVTEDIFPMGGAVPGGAKIIQCGVPGVRGTHFHKAFRNKYDEKTNPSGYRHHIYPWELCPILDRDFVLARKADDPISFASQYELSWEKSNIGMFLSDEDWARCCFHYNFDDTEGKPLRGEFLGIDVARLRDSTVITEVRQDPDNPEHLYIVGWWELQGTDFTEQIGFIKNLFHPRMKAIYIDSSPIGLAPLDILAQAGLPVQGISFDIQHKDKLYKHLQNLIQQGKIHWPKFPPKRFSKEYLRFKQQMMELEKEYKLSGLMSCHANLDDRSAKDDYPDSVALAVWGASQYIQPSAYTV